MVFLCYGFKDKKPPKYFQFLVRTIKKIRTTDLKLHKPINSQWSWSWIAGMKFCNFIAANHDHVMTKKNFLHNQTQKARKCGDIR